VRIGGGGTALEIINSVEGGRYRDDPPPGDPDKRLEFNKADTDFNLLGLLTNLPARPFSSTTHRLVIYNTGVTNANAYENANVITPAGTSISIDADGADPTEDHVTLGAGFQFLYQSPGQRIYLVDTPVSYLCDTGAGTLTRYSAYPIAGTQQTSAGGMAGVGATGALLANQISACAFSYQPGTSQRAGLVTLTLTLNDSDGNTVTLLHQVHVENVP
jgi:MSHA biogenesis protein MshO